MARKKSPKQNQKRPLPKKKIKPKKAGIKNVTTSKLPKKKSRVKTNNKKPLPRQVNNANPFNRGRKKKSVAIVKRASPDTRIWKQELKKSERRSSAKPIRTSRPKYLKKSFHSKRNKRKLTTINKKIKIDANLSQEKLVKAAARYFKTKSKKPKQGFMKLVFRDRNGKAHWVSLVRQRYRSVKSIQEAIARAYRLASNYTGTEFLGYEFEQTIDE